MTLTPFPPNPPKSPVVDLRRFLTDEEAVDLYFYMKQVCSDAIYNECILDAREFNSFALQEFINSRRFNEPIIEEYYSDAWLPKYRHFLKQLWDYTNRQLRFSGKNIRLPFNIFTKFIFYLLVGLSDRVLIASLPIFIISSISSRLIEKFVPVWLVRILIKCEKDGGT